MLFAEKSQLQRLRNCHFILLNAYLHCGLMCHLGVFEQSENKTVKRDLQ